MLKGRCTAPHSVTVCAAVWVQFMWFDEAPSGQYTAVLLWDCRRPFMKHQLRVVNGLAPYRSSVKTWA